MKKFTVPCDFGGQKAPFTIYIGDPDPNHHPLHFQAEWLSKERGGVIPSDVMDSISKLYNLAQKNNVSFEELCVYALSENKDEQVAQQQEAAVESMPVPPGFDATPGEAVSSSPVETPIASEEEELSDGDTSEVPLPPPPPPFE